MLLLKLKGFWQRKGLGQNFLTDGDLLKRIAVLASCDAETLVVEIGPGPGTLTAALATQAAHVVAIELDERLRPLHEEAFAGAPNVEFVYADALKLDLHALARTQMERHGLRRVVLAGNLPFQITSPFLFAQCDPAAPWARICVMIQKEVAVRVGALPGGRSSKDYGVLSAKLAYFYRTPKDALGARIQVPSIKFDPPPKVDATVLALDRAPEADRPSTDEWEKLADFVEAAFAQRRKMIANSLSSAWDKHPTREQVQEALIKLGIDLMARAETLHPPTLRALHKVLSAD